MASLNGLYLPDQVLLAPATAADTSLSFGINVSSSYRAYTRVSVFAPGLAGSETVTLETTVDGTNWVPVVMTSNNLTATNNLIIITTPKMSFRCVKPVTAAAVGIYLYGSVIS